MTSLIVFRPVADLQRSREFYVSVLGMTLVRDQGACLIVRAARAAHLGFCRAGYDGRDGPLPTDARWITTLVVDDPHAVHASLLAAGVTVDGPPRANPRFGIVQFFVRDPDGYRIEVQSFDEPLPDRAPSEGERAAGASRMSEAAVDAAVGAARPAVARSRVVRAAYAGLGWIAVAFGAIGVVVPGWPTTVWLLVAAFFFARSSPRFHRWLLSHRWFGPFLKNVQDGRGMPLRAKVLTVATIFASAGGSAIWTGITVRVDLGILIAVLGAIGIVCVLRLPTRRRDAAATGAQSSSTSSTSAGPLR
ncbi:MAG: DUF454 family protein [Trueperaceae bacterium]